MVVQLAWLTGLGGISAVRANRNKKLDLALVAMLNRHYVRGAAEIGPRAWLLRRSSANRVAAMMTIVITPAALRSQEIVSIACTSTTIE